MLGDVRAFAGFAVPDLDVAEAFYTGPLGLLASRHDDLLTLHLAGGSEVLVYPKRDHVPAAFTILNFPVDDVPATVAGLTARGVSFERYPGTAFATDEEGIFRGDPLVAWFRDPAGNVLSVVQDG